MAECDVVIDGAGILGSSTAYYIKNGASDSDRSSSAFAGLHGANTQNCHPIIFEENGLMMVGGASGNRMIKADAIGRIAEALCDDKGYVHFYGDKKFKVSDLSLKKRYVEPEKLVL